MGLSAKVGEFSIDNTRTAGQTQAITGLGFHPKAIIFWWTGYTGTANDLSAGHSKRGTGITDGINDAAQAIYITHNVGTADTGSYHTNANCIAIQSGPTTLDGLAALDSFDADGFTLLINDAFTAAYTVCYLALGGSDLTNVKVQEFNLDTTSGAHDQAVTGVGFQPDALFIVSATDLGPPGFPASAQYALGFAIGGGATKNYGMSGTDVDAAAAANTSRYLKSGESIQQVTASSGAYTDRAYVKQMDPNGFTLTWIEKSVTTPVKYWALCLKGIQVAVGDFLTQTDTTTGVTETIGFQPSAVFCMSHQYVEQAADTPDLTHGYSVNLGAFTGPAERRAMSTFSKDASDPMSVTNGYRDDAFYLACDEAAPTTLRALMDVESINADGFTLVMDDAEAAQTYVAWIAFGPAAGGGSASGSAALEAVGSSSAIHLLAGSAAIEAIGDVAPTGVVLGFAAVETAAELQAAHLLVGSAALEATAEFDVVHLLAAATVIDAVGGLVAVGFGTGFGAAALDAGVTLDAFGIGIGIGAAQLAAIAELAAAAETNVIVFGAAALDAVSELAVAHVLAGSAVLDLTAGLEVDGTATAFGAAQVLGGTEIVSLHALAGAAALEAGLGLASLGVSTGLGQAQLEAVTELAASFVLAGAVAIEAVAEIGTLVGLIPYAPLCVELEDAPLARIVLDDRSITLTLADRPLIRITLDDESC